MSHGKKTRSRRSAGQRRHGDGRPHPGAGRAEGGRQRGGQPGNTNALTHGLYSQTLPPEALAALQEARQLSPTDLTEEIATLRARLSALPAAELQPMLTGFALLARLAAAQYRMSPGQTEDLAAAVTETVRQLGAVFLPPEGVE